MSNLTGRNDRPPQGGFCLDKQEGKLFGVCAGLENSTGIDALVWRLAFVGGTLLGFGLAIIIYIAIALIAD